MKITDKDTSKLTDKILKDMYEVRNSYKYDFGYGFGDFKNYKFNVSLCMKSEGYKLFLIYLGYKIIGYSYGVVIGNKFYIFYYKNRLKTNIINNLV